MVDTGHDQVDQVVEKNKTAPVCHHVTQRQRHSTLQPTHHRQKICLYLRAIDQRRADDDHLYTCFLRQRPQPRFSLALGDSIRITRRRNLIGRKWMPRQRVLPIDLYRTHEDETPHPYFRRLSGQTQRPIDIHPTELGQRVTRFLVHDMHPGCAMNDYGNFGKRRNPILLRTQRCLDNIHTRQPVARSFFANRNT